MPYKSDAQRRFFNSEAGKKKIGEKEVEHWNKESKGLKLPEKVGDAIGATPKEEFDRLSNYIDNLVKEKAHPKYIKREVSSIKKGIPSKISSNVLTKELGSELNKKINQVLRQIEVKDAVNGSVQDFLNMMQGKNQIQVEQIIKKAKGNPNAEEAYKKWKKQNIKDAADSVVYTLFVNKKPVKEFSATMLPVSEAQKFMHSNGIKEGVLQSSLTGKQWKILAREIKDTEPEYDPVTKTLKVKTLGSKDAVTVFVDESDYRMSHHKNPSGRGTWIFGIGSKDMSAWKEFYGTYLEAKNQAKKVAVERNIKTIYTMG